MRIVGYSMYLGVKGTDVKIHFWGFEWNIASIYTHKQQGYIFVYTKDELLYY